MPYFIAAPCIDVMDKSCIEECPVDCIYEGDRKLYINPRECIDCGACEPVCPETAIFTDIKAPASMAGFAPDNQRFFAEPLPGRSVPVGNPGGSAKAGRIGADTLLVQSWAAGSSGGAAGSSQGTAGEQLGSSRETAGKQPGIEVS